MTTSNTTPHAASVTGIREGVRFWAGFWVVVALVLVAVAACAFFFPVHVVDAASWVGP